MLSSTLYFIAVVNGSGNVWLLDGSHVLVIKDHLFHLSMSKTVGWVGFFPCQEWLGNCKVNYADIFYIQFFNTSFKRQYCKESDPVGADCRLALYL